MEPKHTYSILFNEKYGEKSHSISIEADSYYVNSGKIVFEVGGSPTILYTADYIDQILTTR